MGEATCVGEADHAAPVLVDGSSRVVGGAHGHTYWHRHHNRQRRRLWRRFAYHRKWCVSCGTRTEATNIYRVSLLTKSRVLLLGRSSVISLLAFFSTFPLKTHETLELGAASATQEAVTAECGCRDGMKRRGFSRRIGGATDG
ncbi:hypothetical protein SRHO_G00190640 [Serrasalmus rhombeus]